MAGSMFVVAPVLVIFVVAQRHIIRAFTFTSLKSSAGCALDTLTGPSKFAKNKTNFRTARSGPGHLQEDPDVHLALESRRRARARLVIGARAGPRAGPHQDRRVTLAHRHLRQARHLPEEGYEVCADELNAKRGLLGRKV